MQCSRQGMYVKRAYSEVTYPKYKDLHKDRSSLIASKTISSHTIEVSTLGFISDLPNFSAANNISVLPVTVKQAIVHCAVKRSFDIYCSRNSLMHSDHVVH